MVKFTMGFVILGLYAVTALVCVVTTLVGIIALPILIRRKNIQIPWLLLAAAVGPAVATGLGVEAPWFTTNGAWRVLRLIFLFSWVPALVALERQRRLTYTNSPAKWLFRGTLFSVMFGFSCWAANKVESLELIQAHANGNAWCWLVTSSDGEDGYLFTRIGDGPLRPEKLLDSVGYPKIYSYSIRWVDSQIELRSLDDSIVTRYDPVARISEHTYQSGDRYRFNHTSRVNDMWNPKTKAWGPIPPTAESKKDRAPASTKNSLSRPSAPTG